MLILGHRGASAYACENTVSAFELAFKQAAHGIECDVIQVDGVSFVIHDLRLERTTNGSGYVSTTAPATLQTLDAGNGQRIPQLADVFQCLPKGAWCNLELKYIHDVQGWTQELSQLLAQFPEHTSKLVVSSFNHQWLAQFSQLMPTIKVAFLIAHYPVKPQDYIASLPAYGVNVDLTIVDKELVETIHKLNKKVWVFTVNHKEDMKRCLTMGVDGIFTNYPDVALSVTSQN